MIESVKHDNDVSIEKIIVQDKTVPFSFQVSVEEMFGAMTFLDSGTVKVFAVTCYCLKELVSSL